MVRRSVLVLVALALVVLATGPSASAQTKKRLDPRGDGPPSGDVRSIRVQNNANKLAVTVRLARVVKGRSAVVVGTSRDFDSDDQAAVLVDVFPVARGKYRVRGYVYDPTEDEFGTFARLRCAEQDVTVRRGRAGFVRVVVAQSCLGPVAGRLETAALGYDKRATGRSQLAGIDQLRASRRGDADQADGPDAAATDDETAVVSTRRG